MKTKIKFLVIVCISITLILSINYIFNNFKKPTFLKEVTVFKIHRGDFDGYILSAISLHKGKLYYFKNDSMLMAYHLLPFNKAIAFQNDSLKLILNNIKYESLNKVKDCDDCSYGTMDDFILRFKNKNVVLPGSGMCNIESSCYFLNTFTNAFNKNEIK
jgi:hypothetical protein